MPVGGGASSSIWWQLPAQPNPSPPSRRTRKHAAMMSRISAAAIAALGLVLATAHAEVYLACADSAHEHENAWFGTLLPNITGPDDNGFTPRLCANWMILDNTDAESRIREQCQCTSYSCNSFNCCDSDGTLPFRADLDEMRERLKAVGKGYAVDSDSVWDAGRCLREFTCAIHSWLLEEGVGAPKPQLLRDLCNESHKRRSRGRRLARLTRSPLERPLPQQRPSCIAAPCRPAALQCEAAATRAWSLYETSIFAPPDSNA
eukprot:scaffold192_cov190-Pinguiococcus_pyrenoidosus.AAC.15